MIFDIFFAFDSDDIRKESEPRLADNSRVLRRHPDWKLRFEGHTDSIAQDDYKLKLSQRRAAAVKSALVGRYGIGAAVSRRRGWAKRARGPRTTRWPGARGTGAWSW